MQVEVLCFFLDVGELLIPSGQPLLEITMLRRLLHFIHYLKWKKEVGICITEAHCAPPPIFRFLSIQERHREAET